MGITKRLILCKEQKSCDNNYKSENKTNTQDTHQFIFDSIFRSNFFSKPTELGILVDFHEKILARTVLQLLVFHK